jgi:tRNA pseudouridine38-40 synthase
MSRYKLTIAYDGSEYAGWQAQPVDRTIQRVIEEALCRLTGERAGCYGSGRTDSGVHARGQVAHVDLARPAAPDKLVRGLNALLPADIRILNARKVPPTFHARRSVRRKEYRYFIWNAPVLPPFYRRYRTHVRTPLNVGAMREAAKHLEGEHDFAAFTANPNRPVKSTTRRLEQLRVTEKGNEIIIVARSDGFLYKMVRSLCGFLIRVGEGAVAPQETAAVLASRTRTARVPTAPPQGLFLWHIRY